MLPLHLLPRPPPLVPGQVPGTSAILDVPRCGRQRSQCESSSLHLQLMERASPPKVRGEINRLPDTFSATCTLYLLYQRLLPCGECLISSVIASPVHAWEELIALFFHCITSVQYRGQIEGTQFKR